MRREISKLKNTSFNAYVFGICKDFLEFPIPLSAESVAYNFVQLFGFHQGNQALKSYPDFRNVSVTFSFRLSVRQVSLILAH